MVQYNILQGKQKNENKILKIERTDLFVIRNTWVADADTRPILTLLTIISNSACSAAAWGESILWWNFSNTSFNSLQRWARPWNTGHDLRFFFQIAFVFNEKSLLNCWKNVCVDKKIPDFGAKNILPLSLNCLQTKHVQSLICNFHPFFYSAMTSLHLRQLYLNWCQCQFQHTNIFLNSPKIDFSTKFQNSSQFPMSQKRSSLVSTYRIWRCFFCHIFWVKQKTASYFFLWKSTKQKIHHIMPVFCVLQWIHLGNAFPTITPNVSPIWWRSPIGTFLADFVRCLQYKIAASKKKCHMTVINNLEQSLWMWMIFFSRFLRCSKRILFSLKIEGCNFHKHQRQSGTCQYFRDHPTIGTVFCELDFPEMQQLKLIRAAKNRAEKIPNLCRSLAIRFHFRSNRKWSQVHFYAMWNMFFVGLSKAIFFLCDDEKLLHSILWTNAGSHAELGALLRRRFLFPTHQHVIPTLR